MSPLLLHRRDRAAGPDRAGHGPHGDVTVLPPCWTVLHRQNRPGLVRVAAGAGTHVVRVGDAAVDGPDGAGTAARATSSAVLRADGEVEVRRRNSPPAVLLGRERPVVLPADGRDRQRAALAPGEGLLLPTCALLEQVPAVVGVLVDVLRHPSLAPGPAPLLGLLDALLAGHDAPEDALAVVLHDAPAGAGPRPR